MKPLQQTIGLTERVFAAIRDDILDGTLPAGAHLVQEQLAAGLGVSRQPVQQAMALLKADGLVEEIGTRGLKVAALDLELMQSHYDLRAVLDGYAARTAAERVKMRRLSDHEFATGIERVFVAGRRAIARGATGEQIRADEAFHKLIYEFSGNTVLTETAEPHWRYLRRAMAAVLRHATPPGEIWEQHAAIANAICTGDPDRAGALAEAHARGAASLLAEAMRARAVSAREVAQ